MEDVLGTTDKKDRGHILQREEKKRLVGFSRGA